jgi:hypothetical protein
VKLSLLLFLFEGKYLLIRRCTKRVLHRIVSGRGAIIERCVLWFTFF